MRVCCAWHTAHTRAFPVSGAQNGQAALNHTSLTFEKRKNDTKTPEAGAVTMH